MTCKDCIYRAMCYNHGHYGRDDEETCEMFKNKADFVEVVRCKDCECYEVKKFYGKTLYDCSHPSGCRNVSDDRFCCYGIPKEGAK